MKDKISKQFDNTLFSQQDIDYVKEQVDEHIMILYNQNTSIKNNSKILEIENKIDTLYNLEIKKLLYNYRDALTETIEQQNCLAYYLGIKKGIELKKL